MVSVWPDSLYIGSIGFRRSNRRISLSSEPVKSSFRSSFSATAVTSKLCCKCVVHWAALISQSLAHASSEPEAKSWLDLRAADTLFTYDSCPTNLFFLFPVCASHTPVVLSALALKTSLQWLGASCPNYILWVWCPGHLQNCVSVAFQTCIVYTIAINLPQNLLLVILHPFQIHTYLLISWSWRQCFSIGTKFGRVDIRLAVSFHLRPRKPTLWPERIIIGALSCDVRLGPSYIVLDAIWIVLLTRRTICVYLVSLVSSFLTFLWSTNAPDGSESALRFLGLKSDIGLREWQKSAASQNHSLSSRTHSTWCPIP